MSLVIPRTSSNKHKNILLCPKEAVPINHFKTQVVNLPDTTFCVLGLPAVKQQLGVLNR